jgi:hypothetical protein
MCQNNINVGFSFTLGSDPTSVLNNIDGLVNALLLAMNINTSDVGAVTFSSITAGSTLVGGTANPPSGSGGSASAVASASASLATVINSGAPFGSFSVTSASVTSNGITNPASSSASSASSGSNLALIVGLSVGVPIAVGNCYLI